MSTDRTEKLSQTNFWDELIAMRVSKENCARALCRSCGPKNSRRRIMRWG